jgi:RNA polymerase-binding protein DksA
MESREKSLANRQLSELSENQNGQRRQLEQMLASLQDRQVQGMRALRDRDSAATGDEGDNAVNEDNLDLSTSLVDIATARRAAVEDALQRVKHGNYGVCEDCGDQIPAARLLAVPTAVLCVDCQSERESSSKRIRSDGPFLWVAPANPEAISEAEEPAETASVSRGRPGGARRGRPPGTPQPAHRTHAKRKRA